MPTGPEPTGWELRRELDLLRDDVRADLDRIRADLQAANDRGERHVTTDSLVLFLNRLEDRIKEHDTDIAEERTMRRADIIAEQDARKEAVKDLRAAVETLRNNIRYVATAILLPIALAVAAIYFGRSA